MSCGRNGVGHYNGKLQKEFVMVAEDVEEDISQSSESTIPNKILEESRKELLKEEKKKREVFKELASKSKYIKETPEEMTKLSTEFHSDCSSANGMKEYFFYKSRIESLGGSSIYPYSKDFPETLVGFQKFLQLSGIKNFTAHEVSEGSASILKTCGISNLMPPKSCWIRGAVLFLHAEEIRKAIGNYPLSVGSWYRSQCYNKELSKKNVKVAPKSDHLLAKAVDLFYAGKSGRVNVRKKIQGYICKKYWKNPLYTSLNLEDGTVPNISVGIGNTSIHLGVDSPRGRRSWLYKSYPASDSDLAKCFGS